MKKIKINQLIVNDKSVKCVISEKMKELKIINAILTINMATNEQTQCSFSYKGYKNQILVNSWKNVDTINLMTNTNILVNISDEVQDSINNDCDTLEITIESGNCSFVDDMGSRVDIDYINKSEYQENSQAQEFDCGLAGNLSVKLSDPVVELFTPISRGNGVLPLNIVRNYNSLKRTIDVENLTKNRLNIQQYLIKDDNNEKLQFK